MAKTIKNYVLLFVLISTFASGLNYLIYPLFSRILGVDEYVNITVSLSLFTQVSTFLSSILAITIGLSKEKDSLESDKKIDLLQTFLFKLFFILALLFLIFSPIIMGQLNTPTAFAIPIVLLMLFSIPILILSGYLNGKNKLVKLGLVALVSASCQFLIGLSVSALTHNALFTMVAMALSQLIAIIILYTIFSGEKLPNFVKSLRAPLSSLRGKNMKNLLIYTAFASIAILAISLIQVVDLFIIQALPGVNIKFYADIYVISRVIFFAGMIFIWPFLGEMSLDNHYLNRKPLAKLFGYFLLISIAAACSLYFFGDKLSLFLFGETYTLDNIQYIGVMAVSYKFLLLVVTAVVLYFIVLRRYVALWYALAASIAIVSFNILINDRPDISFVLTGLNIIAGVLAASGIVMILAIPLKNSTLSKKK